MFSLKLVWKFKLRLSSWTDIISCLYFRRNDFDQSSVSPLGDPLIKRSLPEINQKIFTQTCEKCEFNYKIKGKSALLLHGRYFSSALIWIFKS